MRLGRLFSAAEAALADPGSSASQSLAAVRVLRNARYGARRGDFHVLDPSIAGSRDSIRAAIEAAVHEQLLAGSDDPSVSLARRWRLVLTPAVIAGALASAGVDAARVPALVTPALAFYSNNPSSSLERFLCSAMTAAGRTAVAPRGILREVCAEFLTLRGGFAPSTDWPPSKGMLNHAVARVMWLRGAGAPSGVVIAAVHAWIRTEGAGLILSNAPRPSAADKLRIEAAPQWADEAEAAGGGAGGGGGAGSRRE